MKKIFTALSLSLFILSSCFGSKTDFNKLTEEKQSEIRQEVEKSLASEMSGEEMSLENISKNIGVAVDNVSKKYDKIDLSSLKKELIEKINKQIKK